MSTSTTRLPLNFLTIGLPADHPSIPANIRTKVAEMLSKADEQFQHCNAPIRHIDVSPTNTKQFEQSLKENKVDAVVIGNGVRSSSSVEGTYFLEQLIDIIHTNAPTCKVLFNTTPMDVVEAIQRWYPEVKLVGTGEQ